MKRIVLFFAFFILPCFPLKAQILTVSEGIPVGIHTMENPVYGSDFLLNAFEPAGEMVGGQRSNNDWYLAVNDTSTTANLGIIVFRSTNFGISWTRLTIGVQPKIISPNMKMVSAGNDSLYVFFMFGSDVYRWNVVNNSFGKFTADSLIRSFDVVSSSTGSLYLFYDRNYNANIRRIGSIDGGFTWINGGSVSSAGSMPKTYMSGNGDTLILNYYGPVLADTATSIIRAARYRETAPGVISSSGFQDVATEIDAKNEYASVFRNGVVWLIYTTGLTGNIDIKCRVSSNSGLNYSAPINVAANPGVDEYWFSALHYKFGVDINYYFDSLQSGPPTNSSDKIINKYALASSPESFLGNTVVSQHSPVWSERNYKPVTIEDYSASSHYGVFWVGLNSTAKNIYFDGDLVTKISKNSAVAPDLYSLSQNYPNPFNPVTKIDFSLPKSGFVNLKVYDILGKEIKVLVSQNMSPGQYTLNFEAGNLSSGTYFYRLDINGYSEIKKMVILK